MSAVTLTVIGFYIWAALCTGLLYSRLYREGEENRVFGPIVFGVAWPITLPLATLAIAPPPWHYIERERTQP